MPKKPVLLFIAAVLALGLGAVVAWLFYVNQPLAQPLATRAFTVRLPGGGGLDQVIDSIFASGAISDTALVRQAVAKRDFVYRSGQFKIDSAWSANEIARHLDVGGQEASRIVLTNARQLGDMAAQATRFLEIDSAALVDALLDSVWLDSVGYTPQTVMSIAIPNTYNVYWNATAPEVRDRLLTEQRRFWGKENRKGIADSLGYTTTEVYTLASIVESETQNRAERPTVAGVYQNRMEIGMKLDADPTVVFAIGDFSLKRVLFVHLEYDSPYNTYLYAGLPPGPIAMSSISSIDAVLHPEDHEYFFFVTKGDGSGTHSFARDIRGHNANIAQFQRNLAARGIVR